MASARRKEEQKPRRIYFDSSKLRQENRNLNEALSKQIDKIEKKKIQIKYERQAAIDQMHNASVETYLLNKKSNTDERAYRREIDKQLFLAAFGKRLREGTRGSLPQPPDDDDDDEETAILRRRFSRSATIGGRTKSGRRLTEIERDQYFAQLARPRLSNYLLAAQTLVVRIRSQSRGHLSKNDLLYGANDYEESLENKRTNNHLRNIYLERSIRTSRAQSARVEGRIRSFCSEIQSFARAGPEKTVEVLTA